MRRLLRILLNAAMVLSLMLCVVTVLLWVRSRSAMEWLPISTSTENEGGGCVVMDRTTSYLIVSQAGCVAVRRTFLPFGDRCQRTSGIEAEMRLSQLDRADDIDELGVITSWAGFEVATGRRSLPSQGRVLQRLAIPYWSLTVATGLAAGMGLSLTVRHGRHRRSGFCDCCGYDLRATPERCPECGAIPKTLVSSSN
jgi:hypothetical protein